MATGRRVSRNPAARMPLQPVELPAILKSVSLSAIPFQRCVRKFMAAGFPATWRSGSQSMWNLQSAEARAFGWRFSRISGCRRNTRSLSENEACNLLHHCFHPAHRYTFTLRHTAKHRHRRITRRILPVEAGRNLGETLGRVIPRWIYRTRVAG